MDEATTIQLQRRKRSYHQRQTLSSARPVIASKRETPSQNPSDPGRYHRSIEINSENILHDNSYSEVVVEWLRTMSP
ncbi:uncharacterized protein B0I36DRAFT_47488 [Microdochium trichocladiopsis]|uniref:Uncharacterized protein n=1 Tax=Microdochium trichocladiopsis TaxID=1682393 RepID=A0A9P8XVR2_9PEZI|nr:uncharacterized protein B0I36DRAFT_79823 [Microdochium trichocladiopsis]XP_046006166.1 uncharacterized protein B0I36DRAFT_47488 [Microdochium trichocladiopsis]KAH7009090.1 hypothetical protein B0I36DRAFT_79823 [Microdochium trichocladiopsis]KAH7016542.1 hypothetical protein B0I36DRAFT_47488 [Microdochium trichocladiopsis]